jgi:multiple inositol-polyphosphate phosphatase/2,3-bisphosphoglycerate 3-phosphatase
METKMKRIKLVTIFLAVATSIGSEGSDQFNHLDYLGSKTSYPSPPVLFKPISEECRPIHINHLSRHGSRHLTENSDIEKIKQIINIAHDNHGLTDQLFHGMSDLIKEYTFIEHRDALGQLTDQGIKELQSISERMYENFSTLFTDASPNKPLIFQSTYVRRTKDSLQAFLDTLISAQPNLLERSQMIFGDKADPLLRFFNNCNSYQQYLDDGFWRPIVENTIWNRENLFHISRFLERIFHKEFLLQLDDKAKISLVRNFYHLCQLEENIDHHGAHPFCAFFAFREEIEPFNWEDDANTYFKKGPAGDHSLPYDIACLLLNDFITAGDQAIIEPNTAPIANFRFAHEETIAPFLVLLGLYQHVTIDDVLNHPEQRPFRINQIAPMAANLQWILYQCPREQYIVHMRHNEVNIPFPIPACSDQLACDWNEVKRFYETRSCDRATWENEICHNDEML